MNPSEDETEQTNENAFMELVRAIIEDYAPTDEPSVTDDIKHSSDATTILASMDKETVSPHADAIACDQTSDDMAVTTPTRQLDSLDNAVQCEESKYIAAKDARLQYLLTNRELKACKQRISETAVGKLVLFDEESCYQFAVSKYGVRGLQKRLDTRESRANTKRKRDASQSNNQVHISTVDEI